MKPIQAAGADDRELSINASARAIMIDESRQSFERYKKMEGFCRNMEATLNLEHRVEKEALREHIARLGSQLQSVMLYERYTLGDEHEQYHGNRAPGECNCKPYVQDAQLLPDYRTRAQARTELLRVYNQREDDEVVRRMVMENLDCHTANVGLRNIVDYVLDKVQIVHRARLRLKGYRRVVQDDKNNPIMILIPDEQAREFDSLFSNRAKEV